MEKEKMTNKPFFLIINGPSCGGKSTTAKVIHEQYAGIYLASGDKIKWQISGYNFLLHMGTVYDMVLETIRVSLRHGIPVIKEGALYQPERFIEVSKEFNVPLFVANVSAPRHVLEKRFQERVEKKKLDPTVRIANIDPKRFDELYSMYHDTKMASSLEFDSSVLSPEEIAGNIVTHIQNALQ